MKYSIRPRAVLPLVVTIVALTLSGCRSWRLEPTALTTQPERGTVFQLWVGGEGQQYHEVTMTGDSLHAVLYRPTSKYQNARRSFALSDIDSVRKAGFSAGKTAGNLVVVLGLFAGFVMASCC